jgi:muramidase (phage lysozyme)
MGRYQIVGRTLRGLMKAHPDEFGPNVIFNAETQDKMFIKLAERRLARVNTVEEGIRELRKEWAGLEKVPDSTLIPIVSELIQVDTPDPEDAPLPPENPRR